MLEVRATKLTHGCLCADRRSRRAGGKLTRSAPEDADRLAGYLVYFALAAAVFTFIVNTPGRGIICTSASDIIVAGNRAHIREQGIEIPAQLSERINVLVAKNRHQVSFGWVVRPAFSRGGGTRMVVEIPERHKDVDALR